MEKLMKQESGTLNEADHKFLQIIQQNLAVEPACLAGGDSTMDQQRVFAMVQQQATVLEEE